MLITADKCQYTSNPTHVITHTDVLPDWCQMKTGAMKSLVSCVAYLRPAVWSKNPSPCDAPNTCHDNHTFVEGVAPGQMFSFWRNSFTAVMHPVKHTSRSEPSLGRHGDFQSPLSFFVSASTSARERRRRRGGFGCSPTCRSGGRRPALTAAPLSTVTQLMDGCIDHRGRWLVAWPVAAEVDKDAISA